MLDRLGCVCGKQGGKRNCGGALTRMVGVAEWQNSIRQSIIAIGGDWVICLHILTTEQILDPR